MHTITNLFCLFIFFSFFFIFLDKKVIIFNLSGGYNGTTGVFIAPV